MCSGKSEDEKRERPTVLRPQHDVEGAEVGERVRQDHNDIELVQLRKPDSSKHRKGGIEKKEERGKHDGAIELGWAIKLRIPAPEIELAQKEGNRRESAPVAAHFDRQQTGAENQEIGEENDLCVLALADEHWREKPAEKREQSDALRIAAQSDRSHARRDEDHSGESRIEAEELVVLAARPNREIERRGAKAGDALGEIGITALQKPVAPGQHRRAK